MIIVSACSQIPTADRAAGPDPQLLIEQAVEAVENGDYQTAAGAYLQLARQSDGEEKQAHLLAAARLFLRGNFAEGGRHTLALIDDTQLTAEQNAGKVLLQARLSLLLQRPDEAIERLQQLPLTALSGAQLADAYRLFAEASLRQGDELAAARYYVLLQQQLPETASVERRENEQLIWQLLSRVSDQALLASASDAEDDFRGWVQLALIARQAKSEVIDIDGRLAAWQQQYPLHAAGGAILEGLRERSRQIHQRPRQIAFLLPEDGPLAKIAGVLRDGILFAYYQSEDYRPQLRFYDTGDSVETMTTAYQQAQAEGAEMVIGPLRKDFVDVLAERYPQLPVPTLSLNYLSGDGRQVSERSDGFYQFGLAPEDEVQQVAERAWLDGHNQSLAMIPEGPWGDRLLAAFEARWDALGGRLLKVARYQPRANDFSRQLRALLNLDASRQRQRSLAALLGERLAFEPRRRRDADFIFLVASPRSARLIRPQLRFHYAGDLAIYATSLVYSGQPQPQQDRDMNGIIFCDIPWVLAADDRYRAEREAITRLWPDEFRRYFRFYALGMDTFSLLGQLGVLRAYPHESYQGRTGAVFLLANGRLFRQLPWARFVNGRPRLY